MNFCTFRNDFLVLSHEIQDTEVTFQIVNFPSSLDHLWLITLTKYTNILFNQSNSIKLNSRS